MSPRTLEFDVPSHDKFLNFRKIAEREKSSIEVLRQAVLAADLSLGTFVGLRDLGPANYMENVVGQVDLSRFRVHAFSANTLS